MYFAKQILIFHNNGFQWYKVKIWGCLLFCARDKVHKKWSWYPCSQHWFTCLIISQTSLRGAFHWKWSTFPSFYLCSKSVLWYGPITSEIFRGLAALEPPKSRRGKGGPKGVRKYLLLLWKDNYNTWEWSLEFFRDIKNKDSFGILERFPRTPKGIFPIFFFYIMWNDKKLYVFYEFFGNPSNNSCQ